MTTTKGPTPKMIREYRLKVGLTQRASGELIGYACRTWEDWEAGRRPMRASIWDLYILRVSPYCRRNRESLRGLTGDK